MTSNRRSRSRPTRSSKLRLICLSVLLPTRCKEILSFPCKPTQSVTIDDFNKAKLRGVKDGILIALHATNINIDATKIQAPSLNEIHLLDSGTIQGRRSINILIAGRELRKPFGPYSNRNYFKQVPDFLIKGINM